MANKIVRNIDGIQEIEKQGFNTNNQNDLLSDKRHVYVRNTFTKEHEENKTDEYFPLTKAILTINNVPPEMDFENNNFTLTTDYSERDEESPNFVHNKPIFLDPLHYDENRNEVSFTKPIYKSNTTLQERFKLADANGVKGQTLEIDEGYFLRFDIIDNVIQFYLSQPRNDFRFVYDISVRTDQNNPAYFIQSRDGDTSNTFPIYSNGINLTSDFTSICTIHAKICSFKRAFENANPKGYYSKIHDVSIFIQNDTQGNIMLNASLADLTVDNFNKRIVE